MSQVFDIDRLSPAQVKKLEKEFYERKMKFDKGELHSIERDQVRTYMRSIELLKKNPEMRKEFGTGWLAVLRATAFLEQM